MPVNTKIFIADSKDEVISSEVIIIGDEKSNNPKDRSFSKRFTLKPMHYSRGAAYYVVIKDTDTGIVSDKIKFTINVAISNDFDL